MNDKRRLCGDRDEIITHIISEYSKFTLKEYKARQDLMGEDNPLEIMQEIEIWPYYGLNSTSVLLGEWLWH